MSKSGEGKVIICQGYPRCDWYPEKEMPCPWCRVEVPDGRGGWLTQSQPTTQ